ncbi:MAG: PQQ-dependent sugar dehydrogenase [Verrucomicrobiaceae bacterium]|nr:PQQ-dependent sugar dehydrogenase [Verrucomicrobiaceae bacterium]
MGGFFDCRAFVRGAAGAVLCATVWGQGGVAWAQGYGLTSRPAYSAYHGGVLPASAPTFSGSWSAVPAFPNVTFLNALGICELPGQGVNDRRMVVWEREGRVYSFPKSAAAGNGDKVLMLDLSAQCQGWDDSGLLALAFHPNFGSGPTNNRFVFIYYTYVPPGTVTGSSTTRPNTFKPCRDRLVRYTVDGNGVVEPGSETIFIDQVAASVWHNGGGMFFHPDDGFLYLTNGDDAQATLNTQRIDRGLFSGVLRIDVDQRGGGVSKPISRQPLPAGSITQNYFIPLDNPFVGQGNVLEEFYAVGLRSPHRMTIDAVSKRIFIGDVGLANWEEVSVIEPGEVGLNFQWDDVEGPGADLAAPYLGINKRPVIAYSHNEGSAVIGGYVYRGSEFGVDLGGRYIFGDNGSGLIWYLDESTSPATKVPLATLPLGSGPSAGSNYVGLSSFGEDADHELYLCQMSSLGGRIYKLARTGAPPPALPQTLSATGLLTVGSYGNNNPVAASGGFVYYEGINPLWSDRAHKERWFAIPTGQTIGYSPTGDWTFPEGSVFLKHFELPVDDANPSVRKRLETRVLVRNDSGYVYGMTYKWRADNSDADLVTTGFTEDVVIDGNVDLGSLTSTDIGGAQAGSTVPFNGGYAVTAGGTDIFGNADSFRFVHTQKTGDFDIATRLESLDRADLYTKAGLMVRESLAANARNVMALVFPTNEARNNNTGGYEFQSRDFTGGGSAAIYPASPQPGVRFPNAWLRLKRQGDVFTAYYSRNGSDWTSFAVKTLALPSTVYFGMALTSHNAGALAAARFHFNIDRTQPWYFPGRQDCLACHTNNSGGVLGINTPSNNSNLHFTQTGVTDNQLRAWNHVGYLSPALNEADLPTLIKHYGMNDQAASAEQRMRSYLDSNCAHCHRPGGVHAFWDARIETSLGSTGIINGIVQDALGISGAKILAPQSVDRSIIYKRMATASEHYKMPPLAKNLVDQSAIGLLEQWINEATQPPADPLPSPWLHADVGTPALEGDATFAGTTGTFIMSGSGDDIWNNADSFHYACRTLSGDGEIVAKVQSLTQADVYTKAGLMIRNNLDAGSPNAMVTLMAGVGAQLQYRQTSGGISQFITGPAVFAPYYLKLRRQGNVITAFISAISGGWQQIGGITLPLTANPLVGLAVSSHNNAQLATALFDSVRVTSGGLPLELHVNYQNAGAPVPEGYMADTGEVYGARSGGFTFGWSEDNTSFGRDRNAPASPDQRYDTLNHMKHSSVATARSWEIAVPNGTYDVHLVAGDATTTDSVHVVDAEGVTILSGTPSTSNRWIESDAVVTVTDGALTLTQGAGGSNTKLCFVDIVAATTGGVNVALTAPAHLSTHYGPAATNIVLTADASTTNGGASIAQVDFYDGFTLIGSDTAAPFSFVWTNATAGLHRVVAKATDSTSAVGFSAFSDITVSANGPFGLEGEYWPAISMSGTPQTRVDANVQFDWATGVPMAGIPNDNFSVRWRGRILAPVTGLYTFATETDDGVRLWVDSQLLIDKWINQGTTRYTGAISLTAGQLYEVEMHYFDNFGGALARLMWTPPSGTEQIIPATQFFNLPGGTNHRPRSPDIIIPAADSELTDPVSIVMASSLFEDVDAGHTHLSSDWEIWTTDITPVKVWHALEVTGSARTYAGLGDGIFVNGFTALANNTSYQLRVRHQDSSGSLVSAWSAYSVRNFTTTPPDDARGVAAEYYNNTRLSGNPVVSRTENNVNYDYGNGAPPSTTTVNVDGFSARWRARIKPQFSEVYTFKTITDDGVRLWVNGEQLVDKWVGQGPTPWTGQISLLAGQYYDLEMQYFDGEFGASAKLYWSSPSQPEQIIPALRLYAINPTANHRPLAPLVTSPATDESAVDAAAATFGTAAFEDQDVTNTHGASEWEIWTDDVTSTRVWNASNAGVSVGLATGAFEGSHDGRTSLIGEQAYRLRVRHRDSSGDPTSEWSAWSDWRTFVASDGAMPHGLAAEFYPNTQSFEGVALTRIDERVDFDWVGGSPMVGVGNDNFTARWRGRVRPQFTETYTFKTRSDDGARLYVNGQLVIDKFQYQGTTEHTGTISLVAEQYYDIELHYLEGGFDSNVRLLWSSPSRPEQVIPGGRLYLPPVGANHRPHSPPIVAPAGASVNAISANLETGPFSDADVGQVHSMTEFAVYTLGGSLVWSGLSDGLSMNLQQGTFVSGFSLAWSTSYEVRARHKDNSGSALDEWSPWRVATFTTGPGGAFSAWVTAEFTVGEQANPAVSGELADPDNDGMNNLLEYAFGSPPKAAGKSSVELSAVGATTMTVDLEINPAATDVLIVAETSVNLTSWSSANITYQNLGGNEWRATVPKLAGEQKRFVRIAVRKP